MNIKDFRKKNKIELRENLVGLHKNIFKLKLEKTSGVDFKKNHLFRVFKKDIARVLTVLNELERQ